jgi:ubiquinone biosynthesis monooxygenase Coq7
MASRSLLTRGAAATRQQLGRSSIAGPSRVRLSSTVASLAYTRDTAGESGAAEPPAATASTPQLSPHDRELLTRMLRVDHAGEVAANTIYEAQARVFGRMGDPKTEKLMLEMWETEKKHLAVVRQLLQQHRVSPSKLMPLWSAAGSLLGGVTALLGKEAAMACTEAVETVIGEHYDE